MKNSERLGEARRNSEGWERWERWEWWGASHTGRDGSDGSGGNGGSGGSCGRDGSGGSDERDGITPDSLTRQLPTTPKGKRGGKGRLRVGGLRIKNNFY